MIFSHFSSKSIQKNRLDSVEYQGDILDIRSEVLINPVHPLVMESLERALRSPESYIPLSSQILAEKIGAVLTSGLRNACWLTLQAWLNPNDEVLVLAPCAASYISLIHLVGAVPKIVKLDEEDGFFPDINLLKAQCSARTRMLVFSNPQNPTGVLWDKETLGALSKFAADKNLLLLVDESASSFVFEGTFHSMAEFDSKLSRTVIIKDETPLFSGWNIASLKASSEFSQHIQQLFNVSGGHLNSTALFVMNKIWGEISFDQINQELAEKRDVLLKGLDKQHGMRIIKVMAGLSCFPYIRYYLGNEIAGEVPTNTQMFADILARKAGVLVTPGSDYGMEGFFQCSFGASALDITEALKRLGSILEQGARRR